MSTTDIRWGYVRWGYADSEVTESWSGSCGTRDEAIVEAFTELDAAYTGGGYEPLKYAWICSGKQADPASFMPKAWWVLDRASETASDECGDVAEDWPSVARDSVEEKELDELLRSWARKNAPAKFWMADGKPERVTREDLINARMALGICDERGVDTAAVITSAQLTEAALLGNEIDDSMCSTGRKR